jgi:DNA-binding NtrC family response regulator
MQSALSKARYAAATDSVILLLGESGCGKDRMARYIHAHSRRNKGPFFSINCAALSHDIAESELFGHEAGAFTGARARKRGLLELAEGGTLLLNEIGELSLGMQSKLLTFLDSNSFTRLGGEKTITVNARLIAATHRDLKSEVAAARFLPALFYRLDVISIRIPSLRDRIEDLPLLVEEIVSALMTEKHFPQGRSPDPKMLLQLTNYDWPGNIRELRNLIERWLILADSDHLDFPALGNDSTEDNWKFKLRFPRETSLAAIRGQITRLLCMEALSRAKGNKKEAAKLLGISRYSFYRHLKGVEVECDKLT